MLGYFAATSPAQGVTDYLLTQGILGVVCVGLIIVVVYLARKLDKKDADHATEIKTLNAQLLADNKAHAADYREMAKDNQEVLQLNSQNSALLTAKIEAVKGRR